MSRETWTQRRGIWLGFVEGLVNSLRCAGGVPVGPSKYRVPIPKSAHKRPPVTILIHSPHPDDEALIGAFPLRALQESNVQVVNCAITLGGDPKRKRERLNELRASCAVLGFKLKIPGQPKNLGLENVKLQVADNDPKLWRSHKAQLKPVFEEVAPDIILMPHSDDFHNTHRATHRLAMEVAADYSRAKPRKRLLLLQTEYWHPMKKPNLMVGVTPNDEATLVMAVAEHGGEVNRNPYHLRHPARMLDNVRRGSEVMKGEGASAEEFMFAELYQLSLMTNGIEKGASRWKVIPPDEPLSISTLYAMFESRQDSGRNRTEQKGS